MPTDVEKAEETLAALQAKRQRLIERGRELAQARQEVSYSAHTGNEAARKALEKCITEIMRHDQQVCSVEAAIVEGEARLQQARAVEAAAADRAAAAQLREVAALIGAHFRKADELFAAAIEELNQVPGEVDQIHACGSDFPTRMQIAVNATMALKTLLIGLPESWHRDFVETLAPNSRRTFSDFWSRMQGPLEAAARRRLGEPEQNEEEAA